MRSLPQGPVNVRLPKVLRVPEGHRYTWTENPLGLNGYYLVSRGDKTPVAAQAAVGLVQQRAGAERAVAGCLMADMVADPRLDLLRRGGRRQVGPRAVDPRARPGRRTESARQSDARLSPAGPRSDRRQTSGAVTCPTAVAGGAGDGRAARRPRRRRRPGGRRPVPGRGLGGLAEVPDHLQLGRVDAGVDRRSVSRASWSAADAVAPDGVTAGGNGRVRTRCWRELEGTAARPGYGALPGRQRRGAGRPRRRRGRRSAGGAADARTGAAVWAALGGCGRSARGRGASSPAARRGRRPARRGTGRVGVRRRDVAGGEDGGHRRDDGAGQAEHRQVW